MLRVCIYHYDTNAFYRRWIQTVTEQELAELLESPYRRAIVLDEGDWSGENLPRYIIDRPKEPA